MANTEKQKNTIYQELNSFFNLNGFGNAPIQTSGDNTKVIIRGNSPEDIKRKALELEQKNKLSEKFFRTTDRGFQKALQYEAARLPAYIDYEGMEYYPIISSALDLFMEESTTIGDNGKMLNIHCSKDRIKKILESFFYDTVNVNVNLPFWSRNLVKYGDNFVLLYGDKKTGITHVKQMVNYEIERFERIQNGKPVIKFKERMTGDEFNVFEIAHFRLLGDDKYLPYGSSVLNKVRRVFRQLVMAEDAMLTYRIVRAGEKKVFKIDVGNIDEDDIEEYIYKVATKFKKTADVSQGDGQIDYRFNILGNDEDYFLPVRNANTNTGVETLEGASNLDKIQDIEYLRDNLFTGLGIPKPFLSFQDAAGGGQNMAQYDVRFAKKVTRIQQALIQELNKMGMIHLYLMGYSGEDLTSFSLTLNNPSTQAEMLKAELFREKASVYTELTRGENGIAAMSHTRAKRLMFGWSDKEIVDDFKEQKMEKVVQQELADAPVIIKTSGLFSDIDKKYADEEAIIDQENGDNQQDAGGGDMGGDKPDLNAELPNQSPSDLPDIQPESVVSREILKENNFNSLIEKLVYGENKKIKEEKKKGIILESDWFNNELNNNAEQMVHEIDGILNEVNIVSENLSKVTEDTEDKKNDTIKFDINNVNVD